MLTYSYIKMYLDKDRRTNHICFARKTDLIRYFLLVGIVTYGGYLIMYYFLRFYACSFFIIFLTFHLEWCIFDTYVDRVATKIEYEISIGDKSMLNGIKYLLNRIYVQLYGVARRVLNRLNRCSKWLLCFRSNCLMYLTFVFNIILTSYFLKCYKYFQNRKYMNMNFY